MGFETFTYEHLLPLKIAYNKAVPMGFETLLRPKTHAQLSQIIKQSLWDLKLDAKIV